ncbi:GNAT family N-acetyltransferase [Bacillus sp. FJAT-49732]|uniref:GNAT family N-acetyltransferase n=1 Tax=Lederbergia citrisecunda TaxID=2833583 RepID=A0A942YJW6_9BACI|nr:GNAT family N-acetyltransferase [Lederbergia citrisecunda]MBS4199037.1 GNAT family N-acetyltransferase [Lederbergia citrisecunda]
MDFTIREMQKEDISKIQEIAIISWNDTYRGIIPTEIQEMFLRSAYNDEMLQRRLEHSTIFVSEVDGEIVGFANFSTVNEDGKTELTAIYLDPEYQGKGIGTALLKKGITTLAGAKEIYINVEKDNSIGLTFYRAKGFEFVSEFSEEFYGYFLNTVRMVLKV